MEKLKIKKKEGVAKVLGTLMGIGGAMILTFYKGFEINIWTTHVDLLHGRNVSHLPPHSHSHSHNLLLGSVLALASCLSYSFWLILQVTKIFLIYFICILFLIKILSFSVKLLQISLAQNNTPTITLQSHLNN